MRKTLLTAGFLLAGISKAQEPEAIVYPKPVSKVEPGLSLGLVDFKEKALDKTWYARLGFDYRVKYPFLVGGGVKVSSSSDIFMVYPDLRAKVRIPLFSTLKLDPYAGVSVGYAENKTLSKKKLIGGGQAGIQLLYFVGGVSFGVDVSYHAFTDSRFNHLQAGFVLTF